MKKKKYLRSIYLKLIRNRRIKYKNKHRTLWINNKNRDLFKKLKQYINKNKKVKQPKFIVNIGLTFKQVLNKYSLKKNKIIYKLNKRIEKKNSFRKIRKKINKIKYKNYFKTFIRLKKKKIRRRKVKENLKKKNIKEYNKRYKNKHKQKQKRRHKHKIKRTGLIYLKCTYNNIIITVTNLLGKTKLFLSTRKIGIRKNEKLSTYSIAQLLKVVKTHLYKFYYTKVIVNVSTIHYNNKKCINMMKKFKIKIKMIINKVPIAHNGCRKSKKRRI
nr:ribosomal protein S11 [Gefionella okellyi]